MKKTDSDFVLVAMNTRKCYGNFLKDHFIKRSHSI